mmetsp:Transcript_10617/g.22505  ORF Transcript_10617/g.22505 Transcript_10617/m.22505 type:complete len:215 (-) Transcript_10617:56-700(-)
MDMRRAGRCASELVLDDAPGECGAAVPAATKLRLLLLLVLLLPPVSREFILGGTFRSGKKLPLKFGDSGAAGTSISRSGIENSANIASAGADGGGACAADCFIGMSNAVLLLLFAFVNGSNWSGASSASDSWKLPVVFASDAMAWLKSSMRKFPSVLSSSTSICTGFGRRDSFFRSSPAPTIFKKLISPVSLCLFSLSRSTLSLSCLPLPRLYH